MSDQSDVTTGQTNVQSVRRPILVSIATLSLIILTILIHNVVAVARTQPVRPVIDPPQHFLPGSPLPAEWTCPLKGAGFIVCTIHRDGKDVHVTYEVTRHVIVATVISAHEYTIGDLILTWGIPNFFAQNGRAIDVYWGTRYAYLITCSFQPGSHVEFIAYYLEEHTGSRWQGFSTAKGYDCLGRPPSP